MKSRLPFKRWAALLLSLTCAFPTQAFANLCDDTAIQAKSLSDLMAGRKGLHETLTQTPDPVVELSTVADIGGHGCDPEATTVCWVDYIRNYFHVDGPLSNALEQAKDYNIFTLKTLPGSGVYSGETIEGTAACQYIMVFRAGQPSHLLPSMPDAGDGCYNDSVSLAQISHQVAATEWTSDIHDFDETLGISPLVADTWGKACHLKARFQTIFSLRETDALNGDTGPAKADLQSIALNFAKTYGVNPHPARFAFGPNPAAKDKRLLDRMVTDTMSSVVRDMSTQGQMSDYNADFYPVTIHGRAYVVQIGHAAIGWREYPDEILWLYTRRDAAMVQVADSYIKITRGALTSLTVN